MVKVIIPPISSVKGKLSIGQAATLVLADSLIKYFQQMGEDVYFHARAYNSQGRLMEKSLEQKEVSDKYFFERADLFISNMEKDKLRLNLSSDGTDFLDHSEDVRRLSQESFIKLLTKKFIFKSGGDFYLDNERIIKENNLCGSLEKITFMPKKFKNDLLQLVRDTCLPLRLSRERQFATPIPSEYGSGFLDPLWTLSVQASSLKDSPSCTVVCGRNMATRYVYYSLLTGIALTGDVPFNNMIIHSIFNDSKGNRMSNRNKNVCFMSDIPQEYSSDMIRYALLRATTFNEETSNFDIGFLSEGQKTVYRIGNLRKFFMGKQVIFPNGIEEKFTEEYKSSMHELNLRRAFDIARISLTELSRTIKSEYDNGSVRDLPEKAKWYLAAVYMAYPFMPEITKKSKEVLGLNL